MTERATILEMRERAGILAAIELAERTTPWCRQCGAPTVPAARDGSLWLWCASLERRKPLLRRLLTLDVGHTRRMIMEQAA